MLWLTNETHLIKQQQQSHRQVLELIPQEHVKPQLSEYHTLKGQTPRRYTHHNIYR